MNQGRTPEECVRTVVHSYESLREQGNDDAGALAIVAHQYGLTMDRARWATAGAYVERETTRYLLPAEARTRWQATGDAHNFFGLEAPAA